MAATPFARWRRLRRAHCSSRIESPVLDGDGAASKPTRTSPASSPTDSRVALRRHSPQETRDLVRHPQELLRRLGTLRTSNSTSGCTHLTPPAACVASAKGGIALGTISNGRRCTTRDHGGCIDEVDEIAIAFAVADEVGERKERGGVST